MTKSWLFNAATSRTTTTGFNTAKQTSQVSMHSKSPRRQQQQYKQPACWDKQMLSPPHVIPYIPFARPHYPKNPRARAAMSGSPNYSNYSQFMRCRDLWVTFRVSFKCTPKVMKKTFPQCNMDYWILYWTFIILHVTCASEKKHQNKVELSKTKGFARLGHESWIYKALEIAWLCIGLVRP